MQRKCSFHIRFRCHSGAGGVSPGTPLQLPFLTSIRSCPGYTLDECLVCPQCILESTFADARTRAASRTSTARDKGRWALGRCRMGLAPGWHASPSQGGGDPTQKVKARQSKNGLTLPPEPRALLFASCPPCVITPEDNAGGLRLITQYLPSFKGIIRTHLRGRRGRFCSAPRRLSCCQEDRSTMVLFEMLLPWSTRRRALLCVMLNL